MSFKETGVMKYLARCFLVFSIAAIMAGCAGSNYYKGMKNYKPDNGADAVKELTPLAEQGNADAQFNLASLYYQGLGVPQDYKQAVKWFRKSADQGNTSAQVNLGTIYAEGVQGVIEKDYPQALMWFIFPAAKGDMEAIEFRDTLQTRMTPAQITEAQRLAREYKPEDAYTKALGELKILAEKGDASAQFKIGLIYYNGQGTVRDYVGALDWFKKAALLGHPLAQYNAGYMYEKGEGTPQDFLEATKYYRQAAERGNQLAQFTLGYIYEKGQGVAQDEVQALMWYSLASIQGEAKAKAARNRVTVWMTPAQIAEGQRLAREFKIVGK
jgi:TPR repeat protein